jgi:hypothetical protein
MPIMVVDGSQTLHVIWKDSVDGNAEILHAHRPPGGGWSAPVNVSHSAGHSTQPSAAMDERDNLHLAWVDSTSGNYDILYTRRSSSGEWEAVEYLSGDAAYAFDPHLVVDGDGALHLVWSANRSPGIDIIYRTRSTSPTWSDPVNLSESAGASSSPCLVPAGDGSIHLFWEDLTPGQYEIFYATRRPNGLWTTPRDISNTPGQSRSPAAALDPNLVPWVFWHEEVAGSHEILYSVRINAAPYGLAGLTVGGSAEAVGIPSLSPEFGWTFSDPDPGDVQTAYRILVASAPELVTADLADLWDSEKVYSPEAQGIQYVGLALGWGETYYWKVKSWDSSGLEGDWSEAHAFRLNQAPLAPDGLLCDGWPSPQRLMTRTPILSWTFQDPDLGDEQGAFRVIVSSSSQLVAQGIGNLWDSGRIAGLGPANYEGLELAWGATFYWSVQTWDEHELPGPFSEAASFRITAIPDPPHDPRLDGQVNPTGIINPNPVFSWSFHDSDEGDGQTAYHLLVASNTDALDAGVGDLWDSSKVLTGTASATYAGDPLLLKSAYCWKVAAWDETDARGPYSGNQFFTTNSWPEAPRYATCDPTTRYPLFGWEFTDPDPNDIQSAYRILVASSQVLLDANLGDMWDSGKVPSPLTDDIVHDGAELEWGTQYYWKVATWDRHDFPSPYSLTRLFALDAAPNPPEFPLCEGQSSPSASSHN